jgi:formate hydrogenlyase subunit 4
MSALPLVGRLVDLLALLLLPPLLLGVINRVKAIAAGRRGAPLLQPYFDILRLLRKGMVLSTTTTWIFVAAPLVTLVATLMAGLFVPLGPGQALVAFEGDLVLFAYLFALGRFFTTAAALDTGSPFEGMGASREVTFAFLTEPALFFVLLSLTRLTGSLSLDTMLLAPAGGHAAALVLGAVGLFLVLLAECSRVPFDDPNTHLELTMIHEVMILDHSGPLLGVILYGAALKLFILTTLLARLALPAFDTPWLARAVTLAVIIALAALIGLIESTTARVRLARIPNILAGAALIATFGFLLMVR